MSAMDQILIRHFSAATRRGLARRGVRVLSLTTIPGPGPTPYASGETGYNVDDNGTGRVLTHPEVVALARRD